MINNDVINIVPNNSISHTNRLPKPAQLDVFSSQTKFDMELKTTKGSKSKPLLNQLYSRADVLFQTPVIMQLVKFFRVIIAPIKNIYYNLLKLFCFQIALTVLLFSFFSTNLTAKQLKVFFLHPKNFIIDENIIFQQGKKSFIKQQELEHLFHSIEFTLAKKSYFTIYEQSDLDKYLSKQKTFRENFVIAHEWLDLGKTQYNALRTDRAIDNLKKAEKTFFDIFLDAFNPEIVSRTCKLEGLSFIEKGLFGYSHVSFKKMLFLNPQIRFKRGYYPKNVEKEISSSVVDFLLTFNKQNPFIKEKRLNKFLNKFSFDYVVFLYSIKIKNKDMAVVVIYSRQEPTKPFSGTIELSSSNDKNSFLMDRLISSWLSCTTIGKATNISMKKKKRKYNFYIINVHSTYLKTPSRTLFYNIGYGFGFFYNIMKNIVIFGVSEVFTSILDQYRDLQQNFNTLRIISGVGFNFGKGIVRGFIYPGLEIHYLGNFQIMTDPYCKFYGTGKDSPCNSGSIFTIPSKILAGVNISTGLRFMLTKGVFIQLDAAISTYFFPFGGANDLNFLISGGLGLGYNF